jgi:hypothetical protein
MKSGGGCGHMHVAPSRQAALGHTLVGKVFSAVEPKAGTDINLVDHFSAAWTPSDHDVPKLRKDKTWITYVEQEKRNENNAYALIQAGYTTTFNKQLLKATKSCRTSTATAAAASSASCSPAPSCSCSSLTAPAPAQRRQSTLLSSRQVPALHRRPAPA